RFIDLARLEKSNFWKSPTGSVKIALSALCCGSINPHVLRVRSGLSTLSALTNSIFRSHLQEVSKSFFRRSTADRKVLKKSSDKF
ncbi:MAG: hypothetical protein RSD75_07640, partial [Mucinivorans sp.]